MLRACVGILAAATLSCAGPPSVPPGAAAVWGTLRLVPREAPAAGIVEDAYSDRRYADAERFDYSTPGFAVVYVETGSPGSATGDHRVALERSLGGARFEPSLGALRRGGRILVHNATDRAEIVTSPALGVVARVEPGETRTIAAERAGTIELFAPALDARAQVFAAPGPWTLVDEAGRFALVGLTPGRHVVHAWHPRLPPTKRAVEVPAGEARRVDLELGVGLARGHGDPVHPVEGGHGG